MALHLVHRPITRLARWLGGQDLLLLLTLLLGALAIWTFVAVADAVTEGRTQSVDERIIRTLRRPDDPGKLAGPHWVEEVARDLTALGGFTILGLMTAAVVGYLLMVRRYHAMWLVIAATMGG